MEKRKVYKEYHLNLFMKKELMFKLDKKFQGDVFTKLLVSSGGSIKASKILGIPASSIRGYKNLYFKVVPKNLLEKMIKLGIFNKEALIHHKREIFDKSEIMIKNLNKGREKRKEYFKMLKKKIPPLREVMSKNYINLELWFKAYKNLVNSNFRKLEVNNKKDYLILKYNNFTKNGYKNFKVKIPKKIYLDNDFFYFFGLWCGDRAGGKRFGVCNQNKNIINFADYFLKKYGQKTERILYITKGMTLPKVSYDKKFVIDKEIKGWVLSIHSSNGVFTSFFYYLQSGLSEFLRIIPNKFPFFAGLFDAEGNVSLYNKSLRWACKNDNLIKIYSKNLRELSLFDGYDGSSILSYNIKMFYEKVLPYMKQNDKINGIKFLYKGEGTLPKGFIQVLKSIKKSPNKTSKEIAKDLKKNKVYSEIGLLKKFGFIDQDNYPPTYKINEKGIKSLGV